MTARKGKIPFEVALDIVPDDLPDGAYFAMAHEISGLEYGDGFDELDATDAKPAECKRKHQSFCECGKGFWGRAALRQHRRDAHGGAK